LQDRPVRTDQQRDTADKRADRHVPEPKRKPDCNDPPKHHERNGKEESYLVQGWWPEAVRDSSMQVRLSEYPRAQIRCLMSYNI
jgi:hypothetical protein